MTRGAGRDLPGGGPLPRHVRRARQPREASRCRCCAWRRARSQCAARRWWNDGGENSRRALRVPARARPYAEPGGAAAFDAAIFDFLPIVLRARSRQSRCEVARMNRPPRHARSRRADICAGRVPPDDERGRADRQGAPLRRARAGAARRRSTTARRRFPIENFRDMHPEGLLAICMPEAARRHRRDLPDLLPRRAPSSAATAARPRCPGTCTCARRCGPARSPTTWR